MSGWGVTVAVVVVVSCSGTSPRSSTQTSSLVTADASFEEPPVVSVAAAVPSEPPPASLAWCDANYSIVPCAFTAFGTCATKVGKGRTIIDDDFAPTACPGGAPPAFMTKQAPVCGRRATQKVIAKKSQYTYEATCNQRETTWANVPHEHRTCAVDADCVVAAHNANCDLFPLAKTAANRKDYAQGPCGNPAQGMCAGAMPDVKCIAGCCNLSRASDRWGTREVAYPQLEVP
jgi:hypothetical protein